MGGSTRVMSLPIQINSSIFLCFLPVIQNNKYCNCTIDRSTWTTVEGRGEMCLRGTILFTVKELRCPQSSHVTVSSQIKVACGILVPGTEPWQWERRILTLDLQGLPKVSFCHNQMPKFFFSLIFGQHISTVGKKKQNSFFLSFLELWVSHLWSLDVVPDYLWGPT